MVDKEQLSAGEAAARQAGIERFIASSILDQTQSLPSEEDSFFAQRPDEDEPELLDAYEQAKGDPVLYAIYYNIDQKREALSNAQSSGSPTEVELAKEALVNAKNLEQYYKNPETSPIPPVYPEDL